MWRRGLSIALMALLIGLAAADAHASATTPLSSSQVVARFKKATGATLLIDRGSSYPGHYSALSLPPSITNQGRYGHFIVYVVGPASTSTDVTQLLADGHTGILGTPGASRIYWEHGRYLTGGSYWLAKKQYGANLVLWWYGTEQKADASFTRVHKPLAALAGP
jgi:hypothetical protein